MQPRLLQIGYKIRNFCNSFRKPLTLGSRAIVVRSGEVLLVKLTYQKGWFLPGGGVDKGETFYGAARRELKEECGIEFAEARLQGVYLNSRKDRVDHVAIYVVEKFDGVPVCKDEREIAEVRFFPVEALPEQLWPGHRRRIEEFRKLRDVAHVW